MTTNGAQAPLFYEDVIDAINKTVAGNAKGLSIKQIAADMWPARNPDTARSEFSRCLNPEDHSHNLDPEEIVRMMEITEAPEHMIFFLCDRFGFERPGVKDKDTFKRELKQGLKTAVDILKVVARGVEKLENGK